jgi:hypothetical protein
MGARSKNTRGHWMLKDLCIGSRSKYTATTTLNVLESVCSCWCASLSCLAMCQVRPCL